MKWAEYPTLPQSLLHDRSPVLCWVNPLGPTTDLAQEDTLDGPSCGNAMRPERGGRSGGYSSSVLRNCNWERFYFNVHYGFWVESGWQVNHFMVWVLALYIWPIGFIHTQVFYPDRPCRKQITVVCAGMTTTVLQSQKLHKQGAFSSESVLSLSSVPLSPLQWISHDVMVMPARPLTGCQFPVGLWCVCVLVFYGVCMVTSAL